MKNLYSFFLKYPSISSDSRKVKIGDLFFALKGENFDGNDYAEKALESGAAYAVIDSPELYKESLFGCRAERVRLILVPDVLEALQGLARFHRKVLQTPVVAITGTNGKTTTKELIAAVLATRYQVCATEGNLNNHIGVPLTLLRMDSTTQVAVVEMGANHPGEISLLANITQPDYGLITNVGKAHLEGFGSLEGVKQTKGALYEVAQTLFVNGDNPLLCSMAEQRGKAKKKIYYGLRSQKGEVLPMDKMFPFLRLSIQGYPPIETGLIGAYNADNVLAALAVGANFGVDPILAVEAINGYQPSNNRSQRMLTKKNVLVVDAYNANPSSMAAALDNFELLFAKHKAVIFGDMLELGADSEGEHLRLVKRVAEGQKRGEPEKIFMVGPRLTVAAQEFFDGCFPEKFECLLDVTALQNSLLNHPISGYTILIKGSRGMKLELVLPSL